MNRSHPWLMLLWLLEAFCPGQALAYTPEIHQQLTFMAARELNRCAQVDTQLQRLSALDTRYIVKANVAQADSNFFVRSFRWDYYNRQDQQGKSALWLVETRFHDAYQELAASLNAPNDRLAQLRHLGRLLNYLQKGSSPAHVVPVFTGRWWRFSMSDRFDRYPVDAAAVERSIGTGCDWLRLAGEDDAEQSYAGLLREVADQTLAAVAAPIEGLPTTWQAYWQLASAADEFGEYGPAGNAFGERTEFRCERRRCLLLQDDPLYADFARQRHVAAVLISARAMLLMQAAAPALP